MTIAVTTSHVYYDFIPIFAGSLGTVFIVYHIETPLSPEWTAASGFLISFGSLLYIYYQRWKRKMNNSHNSENG